MAIKSRRKLRAAVGNEEMETPAPRRKRSVKRKVGKKKRAGMKKKRRAAGAPAQAMAKTRPGKRTGAAAKKKRRPAHRKTKKKM